MSYLALVTACAFAGAVAVVIQFAEHPEAVLAGPPGAYQAQHAKRGRS